MFLCPFQDWPHGPLTTRQQEWGNHTDPWQQNSVCVCVCGGGGGVEYMDLWQQDSGGGGGRTTWAPDKTVEGGGRRDHMNPWQQDSGGGGGTTRLHGGGGWRATTWTPDNKTMGGGGGTTWTLTTRQWGGGTTWTLTTRRWGGGGGGPDNKTMGGEGGRDYMDPDNKTLGGGGVTLTTRQQVVVVVVGNHMDPWQQDSVGWWGLSLRRCGDQVKRDMNMIGLGDEVCHRQACPFTLTLVYVTHVKQSKNNSTHKHYIMWHVPLNEEKHKKETRIISQDNYITVQPSSFTSFPPKEGNNTLNHSQNS